jgi:hypothetical protein
VRRCGEQHVAVAGRDHVQIRDARPAAAAAARPAPSTEIEFF